MEHTKDETVYLDHEEEENLYMEHENEKTLEEDTVDQDDVEKEIASQEICVCQTEQVCFITFAFFLRLNSSLDAEEEKY